MKSKFLKRFLAIGISAVMSLSGPAVTGSFGLSMVQAADHVINAEHEYKFDAASTWDDNEGFENNLPLTTDQAPADGTTLSMDILIPVTDSNKDGLAFQGLIKPVGVLRLGSNWTWTQSAVIPEIGASDFTETITIDDKEYYIKNVEIPFQGTFEEPVVQVTVKFAGYLCDYEGDILISNAVLNNTTESEKPGETVTPLSNWDFNDGIGNWKYNPDWDWQYSGGPSTIASSDKEMMKVSVDYSGDADKDWSQMTVTTEGSIAAKNANRLGFDFYYDDDKLEDSAAFKVKFTLKGGEPSKEIVAVDSTIDTTSAVDAEEVEGMKKVHVNVDFNSVSQEICSELGLAIVGYKTGYKGDLYLDNISIENVEETEDDFVDSTVTPESGNPVTVNGNTLNTPAGAQHGISDNISLVDVNAKAETKAMYTYLKALGTSDLVLFGHQNDTWHKAGSSELSSSDTKDVTGSIAGVVGIDALSFTGDEYSAGRYNAEIGGSFPETTSGNVSAAAALTNLNIEDGAVITLSAHMPNFSIVKENVGYDPDTDPAYEKYDFSGYSPNNLTGDVMNQILPGGQYNEQFTAYLDMIADYASQVDGTVLFRPFHENTGSWFWWGAAFCDAAGFKNVYRYTVEYLRDNKDIHNLLYVYGPGGEAASSEEYGERYPGDDYVDMVGFDMYHDDPTKDDGWFDSFQSELEVVQQFAKEHNKIFAVTETGIRTSTPDKGHSQTALHKTGNEQPDWYLDMLNAVSGSDASYFLVWANFAENNGFYTPYVNSVNEDGSLHGHEMLDNFINYYNDERSIFAENQKEALSVLTDQITVDASKTTEDITGYIFAPTSRTRILDETELQATLKGAAENTKITFIMENGENKVVLDAEQKDSVISGSETYSAVLTKTDLESLGEGVGSISVYADEAKIDTIKALFNLEVPEEDPYEIDGFENYFGVDSLLNQKWTTNKDTGSSINLSLTKESGEYYEGEYGMKFTYNETKSGWAGATISKEVDWSDCNALRFWTIPDGNNQKTVIQITANNNVYETYLNLYDGYKDVTTPILVTIPFSEFVARDISGNPKGGLLEDRSNVTSFGLWVNAIDGTPAVVDGKVSGTIYYDKITAVFTEEEQPAFEKVKLTQSKLNVTGVPDLPVYGTSFTLSTSGGDGEGAVSYQVIEGAEYATVDAETGEVKITGVGTVTIAVTKAEDDRYNAQTEQVSFTTLRADQAQLYIEAVSAKDTSDKKAVVTAKGGSGTGAVTYEVTEGKEYAEVDPQTGKITVLGIGKVTITAVKAGDENYNPASAEFTFNTDKSPTFAVKSTTGTGGGKTTKPNKVSTGDYTPLAALSIICIASGMGGIILFKKFRKTSEGK